MIEELSNGTQKTTWLPRGSRHWCHSYQGVLLSVLVLYSTHNDDLNLTVVSAAAGLRQYVTNLTDLRTLRRHNLGPIVGRRLCPALAGVTVDYSHFADCTRPTACRNQRFLELQSLPELSAEPWRTPPGPQRGTVRQKHFNMLLLLITSF